MKIQSTRALMGPNVWNALPVLEARVSLAGWQPPSSDEYPKLSRRIQAWLPGLEWSTETIQSQARVHEHSFRLQAAVLIWLDVTSMLHALSRRRLEFASVIALGASEQYLFVLESDQAALSLACLDAARDMCLLAATDTETDIAPMIARLRDLADEVCPGVTTSAMIAAARRRGVPVRSLPEAGVVQLGHGARRRWIRSSLTDSTSYLAESISVDKESTKALLKEVGIPVPKGRGVTDSDDAWRTACEIGVPVVVKPRNGDYQLGVGLNLRTREQIVAAYDQARLHRDEVLVERFVEGAQFRVTVVGDRVVAAIRRVAPQVVGDGVHTIEELIDIINRVDTRRGDEDHFPLNKVRPDDDTQSFLAEQGLGLALVPAAGRVVVLSRLAHAVAGGEVQDVTDNLHPEVAARCVQAVQLLGIGVAGVDLIAADISRPLESQGGVILEVNAGPCVALHFPPYCDRPRPVCEAIIDYLIPPSETGRIPTVLVSGYSGTAGIACELDRLLQGRRLRIGRADTEGVFISGHRIKSENSANPRGAAALLLCPDVELAILEQSLKNLREEGAVVDHCAVAIIASDETNSSLAPAEFPGEARAAELLRDLVGPNGFLVVDADDSLWHAASDATTINWILVGDPSDSKRVPTTLPAHRVMGGDGMIACVSANGSQQLFSAGYERCSAEFFRTPTGRDLLRAAAAAWALDLKFKESNSTTRH